MSDLSAREWAETAADWLNRNGFDDAPIAPALTAIALALTEPRPTDDADGELDDSRLESALRLKLARRGQTIQGLCESLRESKARITALEAELDRHGDAPSGPVSELDGHRPGCVCDGCQDVRDEELSTVSKSVNTASETRCPECLGLNGRHGLIHTRYGNGGGGNTRCPLATSETPDPSAAPVESLEARAEQIAETHILVLIGDDGGSVRCVACGWAQARGASPRPWDYWTRQMERAHAAYIAYLEADASFVARRDEDNWTKTLAYEAGLKQGKELAAGWRDTVQHAIDVIDEWADKTVWASFKGEAAVRGARSSLAGLVGESEADK